MRLVVGMNVPVGAFWACEEVCMVEKGVII